MYLSLGKDLSKSNNTFLGPRNQSNILAYPDSIECFFKTSDKYVKFTLTIYSKTMPNYFRLNWQKIMSYSRPKQLKNTISRVSSKT